ncbi:MAG: hypothetical protein APR63_14680 [Desulfuromonas sp. SDB]|nr:MAG: hypothetical protein APR63_14680 [Desulfuromonas sp. SDB]
MIRQYIKFFKLLSGLLLVSVTFSSLYSDYMVWGVDYDQLVQQGYIANPNQETLYYEIRNQQVNFGYYEYLVVLKNSRTPITVDFCVDEQMNIVHPDDYTIFMNFPSIKQILYCGIYQSVELDLINSTVDKLIFKLTFSLSGNYGLVEEYIETWLRKDSLFILEK